MKYPLSPQMAEFVRKTLSFNVDSSNLDAQRLAYSQMCAAFTPPRPGNLEVSDLMMDGVSVRVYRPHRTDSQHLAPCVLYVHGGGWVFGDLDSHDFLTAALASDLNAVVIAVAYRLAPECPFPAAFEDCLAAWHSLQTQAQQLGIDPTRIAIAGDSAGGGLAVAVCLKLRSEGKPQPVAQALLYPVLGGTCDLQSRSEYSDAPLLSSADLSFYQTLYVGHSGAARSIYAAPLQAEDFRGLAPAFIAVAQFDPLRDDGVLYDRALRQAGISTEFDPGPGCVHGCMRAKGEAPEVDAVYQRFVSALRGFLHLPM